MDNNMELKKIWIAIAVISLLEIFALYRVEKKLESIDRLSPALLTQTTDSIRAIEDIKSETVKSLQTTISKDLITSAKTISDQQTKALQERLNSLASEVAKREAAIKIAEAKLSRSLTGQPEQVDLDKLNESYVEIWSKQSNNFAPIVSFNTSQGSIDFQKRQFTFAYIPSSNILAWLKIGKDDSQENSELIKAWLNEAERAKIKMGYTRQYRKTKPSDYGEYTESLYRKGDMYFKTFIQYQRVQGTYGRHSLEYSYYVEIGSDLRRQKYELEQYNQNLGS